MPTRTDLRSPIRVGPRASQYLTFALALLAAAGVATCSGDDTGPVEPPPLPPTPTSITISPASANLYSLSEQVPFTATVFDQYGQVMAGVATTWASSDASVATVSGAGLVTAVGNGSASVTASAGTATGSAAVTVEQRAVEIRVTPTFAPLSYFGDTVQLSAEAFDAGGHAIRDADFTWRSGDESVAVVDNRGMVTAVGSGSASIIASIGNAAANAIVTVPPAISSDGGFLGHVSTVEPPPNAPDWTTFGPINVTNPRAAGVGDPGTITIRVRDHQCEDGDRVAIQVYNGKSQSWTTVFQGEILNQWQSRTYRVTAGYHYIVDVHALNGTGYKGNCSFANVNTGEVFISNIDNDGNGSTWETTGGSGSRTAVNIYVP